VQVLYAIHVGPSKPDRLEAIRSRARIPIEDSRPPRRIGARIHHIFVGSRGQFPLVPLGQAAARRSTICTRGKPTDSRDRLIRLYLRPQCIGARPMRQVALVGE
jgi:hypothetical protein